MSNGISQKYRLVATDDGSFSVYNSEIEELMHSSSGAYEEALLKHVYPPGIMLSGKKELKILDIGFGAGYNALAAIHQTINKTDKRISIFSLEYDRSFFSLLEHIKFGDDRDFIYETIKTACKTGQSNGEKFDITLIIDDARRSIKKFPDAFFDAIFHDPFSPSKNPELWSVDFFMEEKRVSSPGALLTTYSSAPQVRRGLIEAGFNIGRGPSVGPKKEGTVAFKNNAFEQLPEDEINLLMKNYKSVPYSDPFLNGERLSILSERIEKMREFRNALTRQSVL